jgi:hypothetical protein
MGYKKVTLSFNFLSKEEFANFLMTGSVLELTAYGGKEHRSQIIIRGLHDHGIEDNGLHVFQTHVFYWGRWFKNAEVDVDPSNLYRSTISFRIYPN